MNLFIDTNIFLSFYHLTSEELEELHKLIVLIDKGEVVLLLPQQVIEEFDRNREVKISAALKKLKEQKTQGQYPAFCKDYGEYNDLRDHQEEYEKTLATLIEKVTEDVAGKSLDADNVIAELFSKATVIKTTHSLLNSAKNRGIAGNPPGKNGSSGDAINWEALLTEAPNDEDIYIVTDDKDYFSLLDNQLPKDFLRLEWETEKNSILHIYRRLSGFFGEHYPTIKLASELERQFSVDALVNSGNFSTTHSSLSKLSKYTEFSNTQVNEMIDAYIYNSQIGWIVHDDDIRGFYKKLLEQYKGVIDETNFHIIDDQIKLIEADEEFEEPLPFAADDDENPF